MSRPGVYGTIRESVIVVVSENVAGFTEPVGSALLVLSAQNLSPATPSPSDIWEPAGMQGGLFSAKSLNTTEKFALFLTGQVALWFQT